MGWGSEQITGILGSILGAIGNGISDIGAKIKETANIVNTPEEETNNTKQNTSSFDKKANDSDYNNNQRRSYSKSSVNPNQNNSAKYNTNSKPNTNVNTSKASTNNTFNFNSNKNNFSSNSNTNSASGAQSNNKKAFGHNISLQLGEPKFSVYDQGIRGISFPYHLSINNRPTTPITVTAKFCTMDGSWIKSNVEELSDKFGDVFIKESLFVDNINYEKDSYLFLPYGVLDLKETQQICLNITVICNRGIGETLLRFSYRFEYFVYKDDPREPQKKSNTSTNDYYADYFGQPGVEELLGLIAHVIKADSITSPEEVRTVIEFFNSSPHLDKDKIKSRLKYNLAHLPDIQACCRTLRNHYNTQGLLTFVGLFLNIAISDGKTPYCELKVIEDISNSLKIPSSSFQSLKDSFIPRNKRTNFTSFEDFEEEFFGKNNYGYDYEGGDTSSDEGYYDASDNTGSFHQGSYKTNSSKNYYDSTKRNNSRKTTNNSYSSSYKSQSNNYNYSNSSNQRSNSSSYRSSYSSYDNPLWKMFNLPSTATRAELKKAYHEKCKLFHPDKFANAPESKRKEAEELFKNYQAAYEELLKEF